MKAEGKRIHRNPESSLTFFGLYGQVILFDFLPFVQAADMVALFERGRLIRIHRLCRY